MAKQERYFSCRFEDDEHGAKREDMTASGFRGAAAAYADMMCFDANECPVKRVVIVVRRSDARIRKFTTEVQLRIKVKRVQP